VRMRSVGPVVAGAVMICSGLAADDKWEISPGFYPDDHPLGTPNQLIHGAVQTHDVEGPEVAATLTDQDFSYVRAKARHSYEVRLFSTNTCFQANTTVCGTLDRVASNGITVLTPGMEPDGRSANGDSAGWMALRWTAGADQSDVIRVNGYRGVGTGSVNQYDIQMLDTTYLVPRWNNSGTQVTVFLVQNGSASPVAGSIFFYSAGGALLHAQPLSLAANGLQVVSTAGIPALAGASGSAAIAHDGTYGALAGKAVALEPSTGFTFDTLIAPIPY
jgi:hypothetical protein